MSQHYSFSPVSCIYITHYLIPLPVANVDPEVRCRGKVQNAFFYPSPSNKLRFNHPALSEVIIIISLRKYLEAVPGKHSIDSLQKTAILGTSRIIRKVLQCEA
jgi:hypothetical protein